MPVYTTHPNFGLLFHKRKKKKEKTHEAVTQKQKHIRFYLTTKHPWITAANFKNSPEDFRSMTLKTVVLFVLFSLIGEKFTTFFLLTGCNIVYVKYGVHFVVINKVQAL